MKKKAHVQEEYNYLSIKSDDLFVEDVSVHIIGNKIFIETETQSICLSEDQTKRLTNFLHDRIVRPVRFDFDGLGRDDGELE
jgi:hypothetical protein